MTTKESAYVGPISSGMEHYLNLINDTSFLEMYLTSEENSGMNDTLKMIIQEIEDAALYILEQEQKNK